MGDFAPDVKRYLGAAGWEFLRQGKGSHAIWHHPASGRKVTVPSKIKKRSTANGILKDAGVGKKL